MSLQLLWKRRAGTGSSPRRFSNETLSLSRKVASFLSRSKIKAHIQVKSGISSYLSSFESVFQKITRCVLNIGQKAVSMCLKPTTVSSTFVMHVSKKVMEVENVVLKPQKRKKLRRLKKRKYCALFGVDRMHENEIPVKQRRTKTAAPENTTQFIMADKEVTEPFYVIPSPSASPTSHCTSSPGSIRGTPLSERDIAFDSAEEDLVRDFEELDFDLDFFQRDYEATYNRIQEETLLALSKSELVSRYRELEGKEELLQKRCEELSKDCTHEHEGSSFPGKRSSQVDTFHAHAVTPLVDENTLLSHLEELQRENESLVEENSRLNALKCSTVGLARLS